MQRLLNTVAVVALSCALSSCGGSSGGSSSGGGTTASNTAPVINAGAAQNVNEGEDIQLTATATDVDQDNLDYLWTSSAGGSFTSTTALTPVFTAPVVTSDTPITLSLSVFDGTVRVTDTVVITALNTNEAPTVDAGMAQSADEETEITLAASGADVDGDDLSYSWSQSADAGGSFSDATDPNSTYTLPAVTADTPITLTVTVSDGLETASSEVIVTALNLPGMPNVDAGPAQSVDESTTIQLTSVTSDEDGDSLTYAWTQPAGAGGVFSDPSIASPTYTTPNVTTDTDITLSLSVSDGTFTVADTVVISVNDVPAPPASIALTGTITFDLVPASTTGIGLDYGAITQEPARGVTVELLDDSSAVIDTSVTDVLGAYAFTVSPNTDVRVRAKAEMVQTSGAQWGVSVVDNTNNDGLYAIQGALSDTGIVDSERNLNAASGWDGSSYASDRAAAPFAILNPIYTAIQKLVAVDDDIILPDVSFAWSRLNNTASGNLTNGDIGTSFYSNGRIYILGDEGSDTDEYDDHIIVHEWGHYFEDNMSRSDSIGGKHSSSDHLDPRVAFGEGFGNALSGIITDDPLYRDSLGSQQGGGFYIDVEDNSFATMGWFSEASVQSLLYDFYDSDADGMDNIALGLGPIYEALISPAYIGAEPFTTIFSFVDELKANASAAHISSIDTLLMAQGVYGSTKTGIGESNNGGIAESLPVYKTGTLSAVGTTLCSYSEKGEYNKHGNRNFVLFTAQTSSTHDFTATSTSGNGQDPDFYIYDSGTLISVAESSVVGSETDSAFLTAGKTYAIEILDYSTATGAVTGETCMRLVITD